MTTAQDTGQDGALITGDELARMPEHDLTELIDGRIPNTAARVHTEADAIPCDEALPGFRFSVAAVFEV